MLAASKARAIAVGWTQPHISQVTSNISKAEESKVRENYIRLILTIFAICALIASIGCIPPYRALIICCLITMFDKISRSDVTIDAELSSAEDSIPRTWSGLLRS